MFALELDASKITGHGRSAFALVILNVSDSSIRNIAKELSFCDQKNPSIDK